MYDKTDLMTHPPIQPLTTDPETSPTLPGWAYTDPVLFEREKHEIFFKSWLYAGWIGDLREPGDYLTAEILGQKIAIVRGTDGTLRGFHNVCRHRAHHLLTGCGRASAIVCPYHAWTYGTDGRLRSARGLEQRPGFDPAQFTLRSIRVELLCGKLVFFNLDAEAPPLSQFSAGLEDELRTEIADFDGMERVERQPAGDGRIPPANAIIKANWKIVMDNCLECYHCRPVHPSFRQLMHMEQFKVRAHDYWATLKGEPANPGLIPASARNKTYRFWWLWPNTFIEMMPGGAHGFTIGSQVPIDIAQTGTARTDRFGLPGEPLFEPRGYGDLNLAPEDREAMEAVQNNIESLCYGQGRFSYDPEHGETSEEAVHRFQWLVASALGLV